MRNCPSYTDKAHIIITLVSCPLPTSVVATVADLDEILGFLQKPPFKYVKKPFRIQFIFNVHALSYINYLNIQTILLPDTLRLL